MGDSTPFFGADPGPSAGEPETLPPGSRPGRPGLRTFLLALACVAAFGVLAHRVWQSGFDWSRFWATFVRIDWYWLASGIVITYLTYMGRALRWRVLMRPVKAHPSFSGLVGDTIIGFTAVVLFGRPGEIVRPYLISVREKVPFSSQLAAWLLERIYDLLAVIVILGLGLSQVHTLAHLSPSMEWLLRAGGKVAAFFGVASLVLLFLIHRFTDWTERRLIDALGFLPAHHYQRTSAAIRAFLTGMRSTGSLRFVAETALYTILEWILIYFCFFCVLKCLPETSGLGPADALVLLGSIAFGSIVQVPGIGGGMQVVAIMVLTELFGLKMEPAGGAALLLWFVSFASIAPLGLLVALKQHVSWRRLKHLEPAA